jgi:Flp pilus assembly protein TadG
MRVRNTRVDDRSGAAAVEMAFCLIPLFMLFFGIFEYGRFMMDRNLMDDAVCSACRLAVANNTDPNLLGPGSVTNGNTNVPNLFTRMMAGRLTADFTAVPTVNTSWTGPLPTPANSIVVWGQHYNSATQSWANVYGTSTTTGVPSLGPGDRITVSVNTTYKFILPIMIYVPSTVPMNSSVTMLCEGGN